MHNHTCKLFFSFTKYEHDQIWTKLNSYNANALSRDKIKLQESQKYEGSSYIQAIKFTKYLQEKNRAV